jgi:SEC-C motif
VPGVFSGVTISGCATNVAVRCSHCRKHFDAAPGESVHIDTVGGRLRSVVTGARLLLTEAAQDPVAAELLVDVLGRQPAVASPTQIADVIDAQIGSAFAGFVDWLRENQWFAQWLGAGVSVAGFVATLVLANPGSGEKLPTSVPSAPQPVVVQVTPSFTDAQFEELIQRAIQAQSRENQVDKRRPGRAPARNQPCHCGSGNKYKRCCGAPQQRLEQAGRS